MDVLVVGAGISGLMAAHTLRQRGCSVRLLEKGRHVGGRLATQQVGEGGLADHGAQFFTVRTDTLQTYVDRWLAEDLVYVWGTGWSDGSTKGGFSDGYPRYATRGGMNNLAQSLINGLDIVFNRLIRNLQQTAQGWILEDADGASYVSRGLLLTPPMPQTLSLLTASDIYLDRADFAELRRIQFGPCLCGIHEIEGAVNFPQPGAVQNFQRDVYWVADNRAKGISQTTIITTHANAKFSREHWEASELDIILELEAAVQPYLQEGAQIVNTQLKKWRYSVPLTTHPQEYLLARDLPPLVFAGDAFGGRGRVEGAFVSGIAAGDAMADALG